MSTRPLWIDRRFKSRNVEGTGADQSLPIVYPVGPLFVCHSPPDGELTRAYGRSKQEAYEIWHAVTCHYECHYVV